MSLLKIEPAMFICDGGSYYSHIPNENYKHFAKRKTEAYNEGEKIRVKKCVPNISYFIVNVDLK